MTEREAIYARHSVRSYQKRQIAEDTQEQLRALVEQLNQEGNLHLQFLADAGKTFSRLMSRAMGLGTAPSVIACVGPDDATLDERVGYYGEKLVLAAQCMGLNTCWAGTYSREGVPAQILPGERLVIVIAIGYGTTQGKPRRSKTLDQVTDIPEPRQVWFDRCLELALLAPTAVNQQKFEITLRDGEPVVRDKGGILSKIDLGIVRCHVDIARQG